jgi:ABC-type glutathione transport system ATPase component
MSKKQDNHKIINEWVELNLTQETADGSLSKAFEVDEIIDQLTECVLAGRNPIITGESGIGKTSIIHELVRRIESGNRLVGLKGQQVLQLSLRRRASGLTQPSNQMRPEMQKLDSIWRTIPWNGMPNRFSEIRTILDRCRSGGF